MPFLNWSFSFLPWLVRSEVNSESIRRCTMGDACKPLYSTLRLVDCDTKVQFWSGPNAQSQRDPSPLMQQRVKIADWFFRSIPFSMVDLPERTRSTFGTTRTGWSP